MQGVTVAAERGTVSLRLGDPDHLRIEVAIAPYVSMFALFADAVAGVRREVPAPWRSTIAAAVGASGRYAAAPIGFPGSSMMPSFLHPSVPRGDRSLERSLDQLHETPAQTVREDITREFGGRVPAHWAGAARHPRRWVGDVAAAIAAVGTASDLLWRRARPLLEREIERVGRAVVLGAVDGLLSSLAPRLAYRRGSLCFTDIEDGAYDLAGRRLILVPTLSGPRLLSSNFDASDAAWIGYPLPGLGELWHDPQPRSPGPRDDAERVLGTRRAALLRCLRTPATMRELAARLGCAPSTLTFHCQKLEAAGLVQRERRGRSVRLSATERGRELLELL